MNIPTTRRVARVSTHGKVLITEAPLPKPGVGELLIRVACSVVSPGTELRSLREPSLDAPERQWDFGYQNSGVVADANGCPGFHEGDRVSCMGGGYALHTDWAVVPQNLTFKISDSITFEQAAFSALLGTALHAVRRGQVQFGQHVAVVGLGIVGQLVVAIAALCGAHVIGVDRVAMRRETALRLGAEAVGEFAADVARWKEQYTRGYGLDVGVVAFGGDATKVMAHLANAMKVAPDTHAYGRIVVVGGASVTANFPVEFGNIDICASSRTGPGYHDEAWERGGHYPEALVPWNTRRNIEECFEFIEANKIQVEPLMTHRIGLDDLPEACRQVALEPDQALTVVVGY